jgi:DNA primase
VDDPLRVVARVRDQLRPNGRSAAQPAAVEGAPVRRKEAAVEESVARVEREALKVALQLPAVAGPQFDALAAEAFLVPAHRSLRRAIEAVGGAAAAAGGPGFVAAVEEQLEAPLRSGVSALAVEPLQAGSDSYERYADAVLARMHEIVTARQIAAVKSKLQRMNPQDEPEEHARLFGELIALESYRRGLRERAIGAP